MSIRIIDYCLSWCLERRLKKWFKFWVTIYLIKLIVSPIKGHKRKRTKKMLNPWQISTFFYQEVVVLDEGRMKDTFREIIQSEI